VLVGIAGLTAMVAVHAPAWTAVAAYVLAGAGMGLAYPRTSVATLAESTDADRGFNSAALSIADSLGAALTIAASGVAFAVATRADADPFVAALTVGCVTGLMAVAASGRTRR
jgi:hypothetical protein